MFGVGDEDPHSVVISEVAGFSNTLRILLAVLNFSIFVVAILGNSLVLLGTICHDLIKMDRPSLLFLQSIALSDIVISISCYLIKAVTLLFDRWVLGHFLCLTSKIVFTTALFNEAGVIAMLSVYRLWMMKKPEAARKQLVSVVAVKAVLVCFFFLGAVYLSVLMGVLDADMYVNAWEHTCSSEVFSKPQFGIWAIVTVWIFVFIPMFIITTANIVILVVFLKHHRKAKTTLFPPKSRPSTVYHSTSQTSTTSETLLPHHSDYTRIIMTLTSICLTFLLSYMLIVVKNVMGLSHYSIPRWIVISWPYFLGLNVMVNPLIYALINRRFRVFLKNFFTGKCGNISALIE